MSQGGTRDSKFGHTHVITEEVTIFTYFSKLVNKTRIMIHLCTKFLSRRRSWEIPEAGSSPSLMTLLAKFASEPHIGRYGLLV